MNSSLKYILIVIGIICTSFYLFPVYFAFAPSVNSKMALAACGLVLLGYRLATKTENANIDKGFFTLSIWALCISLVSYASMVINNTRDQSFLTYFMSMWVWLGGAYMIVNLLKWFHGYSGIRLICNYFITVCTLQCILALIFQYYPAFDKTVSSVLSGNEAFLGVDTGDRLHGFGAALDVAGLKFAATVSACAYLLATIKPFQTKLYWFYISCFIIISTIGNMISRTTTVGVALGLLIFIIYSFYGKVSRNIIIKTVLTTGFSLLVITSLYFTSPIIKKNLEFGFEGFFSLANTGEWQSNSNDILENMVVFPDNFKTWVIGDGYAANPADQNSGSFDPYYTGPIFHGFYMQTDIGYCRFIFYFGLIGLFLLIGLFILATKILVARFPHWKMLFLIFLCVNLIGWCKVSTDIFVIFAPFLCMSRKDDEESEQIQRDEDSFEHGDNILSHISI